MTRRIVAISPPGVAGVPPGYQVAALSDDVLDWLADLLLLRGVPLSYLVPHPDLLPPESIRFFHVDPNFTAHLLDGALAASDLGAFDRAFHRPIALALRKQAEQRLALRLFPAEHPKFVALPQLSGLLFRSEIVRRWPGLSVTGYDKASDRGSALQLARKDRLAAGLMIVLFAGVPRRVEIAEPFEGARFGVEPKQNNTWSIQKRNSDGGFTGNTVTDTVTVTVDKATRRLDIATLATTAGCAGSGHLSLCLQQTPYVQVFEGSGAREKLRIRRIRDDLKRRIGG
jgi:hypothetical protein